MAAPKPLEPPAGAALPPLEGSILAALPIAVFVVDSEHRLVMVNPAAEQVLGGGRAYLARHRLTDLIAPDSQLVSLIDQAILSGSTVVEYGIVLASPKVRERLVDVRVAPYPDDPTQVIVCIEERSMAHMVDHQLTHRGAARSVAGMAAILAHEVKNPLSGIRGAAQLLEDSVNGPERDLTKLICDETDRIRSLVERVDIFSDDRPLDRERVNIHQVLDHVRQLVETGSGAGIHFVEHYDPSLPKVFGNRDQLIQVFLNLIKNAVEAVPDQRGEIVVSTRYQHGFKFASVGSRTRQDLPIVVSIQDNGPGIPTELHDHLFDPFVTTKRNGTGLGLSLVAKIVEDHGGLVEFETRRRRTEFRVHLRATARDEQGELPLRLVDEGPADE